MKKFNYTVTFLLIWVINTIPCFAQQVPWNEVNTNKVINESSYIFEGKVIKSQTYKCGESICNANIIEIKKIIKGSDSLSIGTIVVITPGGQLGNELMVTVDATWPTGNLSGEGIFFCIPSKYLPFEIPVNNKIQVVPVEIINICTGNFYKPQIKECIEGSFGAFGKYFKTKQEFYQFLSSYPNITIPRE